MCQAIDRWTLQYIRSLLINHSQLLASKFRTFHVDVCYTPLSCSAHRFHRSRSSRIGSSEGSRWSSRPQTAYFPKADFTVPETVRCLMLSRRMQMFLASELLQKKNLSPGLHLWRPAPGFSRLAHPMESFAYEERMRVTEKRTK